MPKIVKDRKLILRNIGNKRLLTIDPHNLFWAITPGRQALNPSPPRVVVSSYKRLKERLDAEMEGFRFSSNLTAVYIDPVDGCNANCPYCYIPSKIRRSRRQMDEGQLEYVLSKIVRYFKRKGNGTRPVIIFHASEPLLIKDIIFRAITDFEGQFYFGLQTNGVLLERADVEFLKRYRVGVGISLDSPDPVTNNRQRPSGRGDGNFHKAVQAMEWFDGYEGLNVITTITRFNVSQLPEMVEFVHSKRVSCILLNPVRLTTKASRGLKPDEGLMTEYFIKAVDKAIGLTRSTRRRIIIGNFTNIILGIVAPTARRLMCDISPCGGGRCFLTITASGEMIPCGEFIGLDGFSGGNIFHTTISKAMRSNPFRGLRRRIVEKVGECKVCDFGNICGAPCPAELYSLGDMYQPSVFCEFYKRVIEYAFKLIAEDKTRYLLREDSLQGLEYEYNLGC